MTDFESSLFTVALISNFIALILYVVFGQVTVRKLRKNPDAKEALGFEFISGLDILNVAQALALPLKWAKFLNKSPVSSLYAKVDLLQENTNTFDRVLAFILYWMLIFTVICWLVLIL